MDLEQIKFDISKVVTDLLKLIQYRTIELLYDAQSQSEEVFFNGWQTEEGLGQTAEFDLYFDLDKLIYLSYLNELNKEKRQLLVESIIESLSFDEPLLSYQYKELVPKLSDAQLSKVESFETKQAEIVDTIKAKLTTKYLSEKIDARFKLSKLVWKGEQKELAELFEQLKRKKWLDITSSKAAYYKTLATLFDVPGTNSLESNLKDYHRADAPVPIPINGIFKDIPHNAIK